MADRSLEFHLDTPRLILRDWRDEDLDAFAAMSADPRVMEMLAPVMDRAQAAEVLTRIKGIAAEYGHTFWAVERKNDAQMIGWCGIIRGTVGPIDGKAEIGWRLAADAWGAGYAREAALASLDWGFAHLPDDAIWAITSTGNARSWSLMERLGMVRHPDLDFDHPKLAVDSPLKRHITYSITRGAFLSTR
jgi:RimJ/RimL family protein N-acetyltransferase